MLCRKAPTHGLPLAERQRIMEIRDSLSGVDILSLGGRSKVGTPLRGPRLSIFDTQLRTSLSDNAMIQNLIQTPDGGVKAAITCRVTMRDESTFRVRIGIHFTKCRNVTRDNPDR